MRARGYLLVWQRLVPVGSAVADLYLPRGIDDVGAHEDVNEAAVSVGQLVPLQNVHSQDIAALRHRGVGAQRELEVQVPDLRLRVFEVVREGLVENPAPVVRAHRLAEQVHLVRNLSLRLHNGP